MRSKSDQSISVFFPCYNDSKTIGKLIKDALFVLKELTKTYEVIVIDDGSTDGSRELLKDLAKRQPKLKVVFHQSNQGYGGALISGFKNAKYDLCFYTDGDGQYNVKELAILFSLMTEDVNFINGIKMSRHDPTYRIIIGNLYSFMARWLFWLPIQDIDCDFRLVRKSIYSKLDLKSKSGTICIELIKKSQRAGAVFRQVSVHHFERPFGQSQFFRPKHLLRTFWEIIFLWFNLMVKEKFK